MSIIVQFDFPFSGPYGNELAESMAGLAESITKEPGLIWKIWTENPDKKEAGGIYLFEDESSANNYIEMHRARLKEFGVEGINIKIFQINERLTNICSGPTE